MWKDGEGRLRYVISAAEPNAMAYIVVRQRKDRVARSDEADLKSTFGTRAEAQTALDVYAVKNHWKQIKWGDS